MQFFHPAAQQMLNEKLEQRNRIAGLGQKVAVSSPAAQEPTDDGSLGDGGRQSSATDVSTKSASPT